MGRYRIIAVSDACESCDAYHVMRFPAKARVIFPRRDQQQSRLPCLPTTTLAGVASGIGWNFPDGFFGRDVSDEIVDSSLISAYPASPLISYQSNQSEFGQSTHRKQLLSSRRITSFQHVVSVHPLCASYELPVLTQSQCRWA